jgi:filamentous hemagglutinin family protein
MVYARRICVGIFRLALPFGLFLAPLAAQVVLDGSLGHAGSLAGPNYIIGADLGQLIGANLFQSFSIFNVWTGQSATFQGPGTVQNVIGRITGGSPSTIDGTVSCDIPGANLFLINPSGMVFGKNASLDVSGSFHASTADYLAFADGAKFQASLSNQSSLTMAPPQAFGFLVPAPGAAPGPLTVMGSTLQVPQGQMLSLTGGSVTLSGATLQAPGGTLLLGARDTAGQIALSPAGVTTVGGGGAVTLTQSSLSVSGSPTSGGTVVIRAGQFVMQQASAINAQNDSTAKSGGVDIEVDGDVVLNNGSLIDASTNNSGDGGDVRIQAGGTVLLSGTDSSDNGSRVTAYSNNSGSTGSISISANTLEMTDNTALLSQANSTGNVAGIFLNVGLLQILQDANIQIVSKGLGSGGPIQVQANDVVIDGDAGLIRYARIASTAFNAGSTAGIELNVANLTLQGGGQIFTQTDMKQPAGGGNAGPITINASNSIEITGAPIVGSGASAYRAASEISSFADGSGSAGDIGIRAANLTIEESANFTSRGNTANGGNISIDVTNFTLNAPVQDHSDATTIESQTFGPAAAGNVNMTVSGGMTLNGNGAYPQFFAAGNNLPANGIFSDTYSSGQAGTIAISAPELILNNGALIRASDGSNLYTGEDVTGAAGRIDLTVGDLEVLGGSRIETQSVAYGPGGDIDIHAKSILVSGLGTLPDGTPSPSGIFSDTLNTAPGGTVTISADTMKVQGGGTISAASLGTGAAGSIALAIGDNLSLVDGTVTTASAQGGGGSIDIQWTGADRGILQLQNSAISTSVAGGQADAGNVTIGLAGEPLPALVLEDSQIRANAAAGTGGNIVVESGIFLGTPDSIVNASAGPAGINGVVDIESPVSQLGGNFLPIPEGFRKEVVFVKCGNAERSTLVLLNYLVSPFFPPGSAGPQRVAAQASAPSCLPADPFGMLQRRGAP